MGRRPPDRREPRASGAPAQIYVRTARNKRRGRRARHAALLVLVALVVVGLWLALGSDDRPAAEARERGVVQVVRGDRPLAERQAGELRQLSPGALRAWLRALPARRRERRGVASIELRTDQAELSRRVDHAIRMGGGRVALPERPVSANAQLPIVKQALRNNCETAALSMLLAAVGERADQLALQRRLPRSGPADPTTAPGGGMVWGDPNRGFVGRPEGGGVAGGYGVYEPPIRALARRSGAELRDLGRDPTAVYRSLLAGRPVMVWVGLSDGPYRSWRSPAGARVTGNFGEHTVVLTGIRGQILRVNDPLVGERTTWTRGEFELMWQRLGRRALAA